MTSSKKQISIVLLLLSCMIMLSVAGFIPEDKQCTIFTVSRKGQVLFGSNEDWHSGDLYLGFYPASEDGYAALHIGYRDGSGQLNFASAINEGGLIWAVNSLPKASLNPHPERPYSHEKDNYLTRLTKQCQTVSDAISLSKEFDFGSSIELQIHIADAEGDAVIISPGPDGEMTYTYMPTGKDFLVSSNFNHAIPNHGRQGWRYDTAYEMLNNSNPVSIQSATSILEAVRLDMLTTFTLISSVSDLKNKEITFYYLSQFNEGITLDLQTELSRGQRIVPLKDYFSPSTIAAGDAAYEKFERRFFAAIAGFLLLIVFISILTIMGIRRVIKKKEAGKS